MLDDGVIDPRDTRNVLAFALSICREADARTLRAGAVRGGTAVHSARPQAIVRPHMYQIRGETPCTDRAHLGGFREAGIETRRWGGEAFPSHKCIEHI